MFVFQILHMPEQQKLHRVQSERTTTYYLHIDICQIVGAKQQ